MLVINVKNLWNYNGRVTPHSIVYMNIMGWPSHVTKIHFTYILLKGEVPESKYQNMGQNFRVVATFQPRLLGNWNREIPNIRVYQTLQLHEQFWQASYAEYAEISKGANSQNLFLVSQTWQWSGLKRTGDEATFSFSHFHQPQCYQLEGKIGNACQQCHDVTETLAYSSVVLSQHQVDTSLVTDEGLFAGSPFLDSKL